MAFARTRRFPPLSWGRRRLSRGPRRRKPIPFKALSPLVARKRREWGWLYTDRLSGLSDNPDANFCGIRCIEFGEFCNPLTPVRIPLITADMLETIFDDNVTIAKMRGSIQWKPLFPNDAAGGPCSEAGLAQINNNAQSFAWPIHTRAWLKKSDVTAVQEQSFVPGPSFVDPMYARDWTDHTGVLREWNHTWFPNNRLLINWNAYTGIAGVCSNTTREAYTTAGWSMVGGTGTELPDPVPAIITTCNTVTPGENCSIQGVTYDIKAPSWWTMSLNRNTPIDLREDDDLSIFVNWNMPQMSDTQCVMTGECEVETAPNPPCSMLFSIDLKVQYQYG